MTESLVVEGDAGIITAADAARARATQRSVVQRRWTIRFGRIVSFILVIAGWQYAVDHKMVSAMVVPSATATVERILSDIQSIVTGGGMQAHFFTTVAEVYIAFAITALLGVGLGVVIHQFQFVNSVLYPYIVAFAAMPRIAIAPLLILWFGFEMESKIVIGILVAIFPTLVATLAGLDATEEGKLHLMKVLGASQFETFRKVRFGDALPYIFAGLQTSVVTVVLGVVVGEFVAGRLGLGVLIQIYQDSLDEAGTFSAIILLSFVGLFNYYAMHFARRRIVFWVGERKPR